MKVTVAIPFFNSEATLADAIRSVFAQGHREWELLLVDDGSTDGSLEIAGAVRDPRVRVISDGRNRGLPTRLNEIAAMAQTELLARMDSDDLMHPARLERQLAFLEAHPGVELVGSGVCAIDGSGEPIGLRADEPLDASPGGVLRRGLFVHPTALGTTAWFRKNLYDPAFVRAEDTELWCRSCGSGRFGLVREPLLFYREGQASPASYALGARSVRRVLRTYGPEVVGPWRAEALALLTHAKTAAYAASFHLGIRSWLVGKRSRPLTAAARDAARQTLRSIRETEVPGLFQRSDRLPPSSRRAVSWA